MKITLKDKKNYWHKWFAWHPVKLTFEGDVYSPNLKREYYWMQYVERKFYQNKEWVYRLPK